MSLTQIWFNIVHKAIMATQADVHDINFGINLGDNYGLQVIKTHSVTIQ